MHTTTVKNWMQYSASQLAIMAVFLPQNGLRSNLRASNFLEEHAPTPPSLVGQVENAEVRKPKYGNGSTETEVRK